MNSIVPVVALALASLNTAPSAADLNRALNAQCPGHRLVTRAVACTKPDPNAVEFRCAYQLRQGERWLSRTATLTLSEREWVWMDGDTPCADGDDPNLN